MRVFACVCLSFVIGCAAIGKGWSAGAASPPGLPPVEREERLKKESCDNLNRLMSETFLLTAKWQTRLEAAMKEAI